MISRDNFCKFGIKTYVVKYVVTPNLNCNIKTIQMRGNNI